MRATRTALLLLLLPVQLPAQQIIRVEQEPAQLRRLPMAAHGRVQADGRGSFVRQWPGTYFETAFRGPAAMFRVGPGDVSLRVRVDGEGPIALVKPKPGIYRIGGLKSASHRLRIDVVSEDQNRPSVFGGFYALAGVTPQPLPRRSLQIEFIGDSYTVGYGNTSPKRGCTDEEVWSTTDTSQGIAPRLAGHYAADYQVNAISGRGIVRNYNGFRASTLPAVYPYVLFDQKGLYADRAWRPQLIVIGLGTNDFSTELNSGEKWKSRAELRSDFENSYAGFARSLRARNPGAFILLWVADNPERELTGEVAKVQERLRSSGDSRVGFVAVRNVAGTACNFHPSLADDELISRTLARFIDSEPQVWRSR